MLDLKRVRNQPQLVKEAMRSKGFVEVDVDSLLALDQKWRDSLQRVEELKAVRNRVSEDIGRLKREGKDAQPLMDKMKQVAEEIRRLDTEVKAMEEEIQEALLNLPNIPHESVPEGEGEDDNVEVRRWGDPPTLVAPRPHWELGLDLGILDFERATKLAGSRFTIYKGLGCRLVRALMNFMLDLHINEHGYEETWPTFLVNTDSMVATGQLPKFAGDVFKIEGQDLYLVPTAEVPITNYHRDEILEASDLPVKYVGYSPCFRSEAGAAGRDTRGLIRQHQFEKVEMVKLVHPDESYRELELLVQEAAAVLERLNLPYRVVVMCSGDTGFQQSKKYDLEVWMPSYERYVEISSCSNFEDFQARRGNMRFRPAPGRRPSYVHTLNGSGVAIGRTIAALLENFQRSDGHVDIPQALVPYMGGIETI